MTARKYKNCPIVEALCEFQFEQSTPWDMTILGLVYEKVSKTFPKKRQLQLLEATMAGGPGGIEQKLRPTERIQFLREDEKALIQLGQNRLVVNHLAPYPTWGEFLPLIKQGFNAYIDVAKPKALQRIGLRYINRIELPGAKVKLEHYFGFRPYIAKKLPQDHGNFIVAVEIPYQDGRDTLKLQLGSTTSQKPNVVALVLDLDYRLNKEGEVALGKTFGWADLAHTRIEEVFEASITDKMRKQFGEVT